MSTEPHPFSTPLMHEPSIHSGEVVQRSPLLPSKEELSIPDDFADLPRPASTVSLQDLVDIFRSDRGALDALLVAPLEQQLDVMADACRRGPYGFDVSFATACYPAADVPALITNLRSNAVNSVTLEAYPDENWIARHPDEARLPVIGFHMYNLIPTIMPRQRVIQPQGYVTPRIEDFRVSPESGALGSSFRAELPDHFETLPDDYYRAQGRVFNALPPQPKVADVAGSITLRFTSTRPTVGISSPVSPNFGFLSLAHVMTSSVQIALLAPVEWLFSQLITSRFDPDALTDGEPLAAITANYVLCGRRSRFGVGLVPVAAHAACGGAPSSGVLRCVA
jgi:hypothetical protein